MREIKAAVIGAGSTYTPELIEGFINKKDSLKLSEIRLMDINEEKLNTVGSLAERMLVSSGYKGKLLITRNIDEAIKEADYIFAQIRVGGMAARIRDEKIPLKYGLLGQETTGAGGFMNALRTVPVMLDIARRMEKLAPNAWLINFSNPSGIVAEALLNNTNVKMIGLCNNFVNMYASIKKSLANQDFDYEYVGLNHLSWFISVMVNGKNIIGDIKSDYDNELLSAIPGIPCSYLSYFYLREEQLKKCLEAKKTRGELIVDLEESLMEKYKDPNLKEKPAELSQRGGALYSTAAVTLADAIENDKNEFHVVGVKNKDTLSFLDDSDIIEAKCLVNKSGAGPVKTASPVHLYIQGLVQAVKAYEKLTVSAAIKGSREDALAALMVHPLIGDFQKAKALLDDMLEANSEYLSPNFFAKS